MKSYTNIEQSKKLAEILPLESADCYWDYDEMQNFHRISWFEDGYNKESQLRHNENNVCAWSLSALLNVIPEEVRLVGSSKQSYWYCEYVDSNVKSYSGDSADNPVDACCNLILRLNKLRIL